MYLNVIVPNDGTLEGRSVLAPAADLAWRCGARIVNVSNTDLSDKSSKATVKGHAMAQSAADVEFWIDLENPLPSAVLEAAAYRPNPIICVASPAPRGRRGRKNPALTPLTVELATKADSSVVVIGPAAETDRGLPMTEVIAVLDGSEGADELVDLAEQWAQLFKLRLVLTALAGPGSVDNRSTQQLYLDQRADRRSAPGGVGIELVQGADPVSGLVDLLTTHENAVAMLAPTAPGTAPNAMAADIICRSRRAIVLPRGPIPETPIS